MQTPQEDYPRDMVQREEVVHQGDGETKAAIGKPVRVFIGVFILIICSLFAFALFGGIKAGSQTKNSSENRVEVAPVVVPPAETKDDYIKSTSKIGRKGESIYYKEFLKNPDSFNGKRINITGKILQIDESAEGAVIQLVLTERYDSVMVYYPGKTKYYQDDWITIYGEGKGSYEGKNAMGVSMKFPLITAKYLKKRASGD